MTQWSWATNFFNVFETKRWRLVGLTVPLRAGTPNRVVRIGTFRAESSHMPWVEINLCDKRRKHRHLHIRMRTGAQRSEPHSLINAQTHTQHERTHAYTHARAHTHTHTHTNVHAPAMTRTRLCTLRNIFVVVPTDTLNHRFSVYR